MLLESGPRSDESRRLRSNHERHATFLMVNRRAFVDLAPSVAIE